MGQQTESQGAAPKGAATKDVSGGGVDWYERRRELREGMVFNTPDGLVMLDRTVPGDGTQWYVADWYGGWAYYDSTIEPGDLVGEPLADPALSEPQA